MAVADLEALGPKFTAELAKLQAKQTGALNVGEEASDLQMKMCVSRDFHMQRISEADAKISRLLQARTKEDLAERKAAEPARGRVGAGSNRARTSSRWQPSLVRWDQWFLPSANTVSRVHGPIHLHW